MHSKTLYPLALSWLLVLVGASYEDFTEPAAFSYMEPSRIIYYKGNEELDDDSAPEAEGEEESTKPKVIPMTKEINVHAVTLVPLNPEAEMLPESYTGVKPPGVDHMEMRLASEVEEKKLAKLKAPETVPDYVLQTKKNNDQDKRAGYSASYQKKEV